MDKVQKKEIVSVGRLCFGLMTVFSCRPRVGPVNGSYCLFVFYLMTAVMAMLNYSYFVIF